MVVLFQLLHDCNAVSVLADACVRDAVKKALVEQLEQTLLEPTDKPHPAV